MPAWRDPRSSPGPLTRAWDHTQLLRVLLAEEAAGRDRSTREIHRKAARLPSGKTFEAWDPAGVGDPGSMPSGPSAASTGSGGPRTWSSSDPSGTGKSHFAEAIAHAAIDRDLRVSWFSLETLTATIARSRIDASTGKVVERIVRSELIVVDDIGLLPAGADEAEALYRLVDAAYEKRSLILTSNLHPARFDTIFPKGLATAAVDRLLHHAHVIVTEGRSHRLDRGARRARRPAAGRGRGLIITAADTTVGSATPVSVTDEEENDGCPVLMAASVQCHRPPASRSRDRLRPNSHVP